MKCSLWYSLAALLLAGPVRAQSLTGAWQGVEIEAGEERNWPAVLRLQAGKGEVLFGVLYQEVGGQPETSVTFQMLGARTGPSLRLAHVRKLNETGRTPFSYWCAGSITFTYDASLEKLTGRATYRPVGDCDTGEFTFYRVKLKSAGAVPAGALSTLRVSGRDVRWFADAERTRLVATGNTYRTRLHQATTFYLTQGFFPSTESPVVPITINVTGAKSARKVPTLPPVSVPTPLPAPIAAPTPKPAPTPPPAPDSLALPPAAAPTPVVLPTVLFRQGTAELLPESAPALNKLAADLRAQPQQRLRVVGHTDRLGESQKNQLLSEQRAAVVRAYLVKAGVAAGRIATSGYGDTRPLYPSPDARNRRVEVERLP